MKVYFCCCFLLLQFYAPWCAYCHTFEPIWYEVGAELKSLGSPVNVGKMDTTEHTSGSHSFVCKSVYVGKIWLHWMHT